jgi:cobalt/nickel transport system permease protein
MIDILLSGSGDVRICMADARLKIIIACVLIALIITYRGFLFPSIIITLGIVFAKYVGISLHQWFHRISEPMLMAAVIFAVETISGSSELVSWEFFGFKAGIYIDGMLNGTECGLKIMASVLALAACWAVTAFTDILAAMSWFRAPQTLVEISVYAYRYIFLLFDEAVLIYTSQKNRLGYAGALTGLRSFGALCGTLLIKAFDHCEVASSAMGHDILLLDEPTAGLDTAGETMKIELLAMLKELGVAILMATHKVDIVPLCVSRVCLLYKGSLTASGAPEDVFASPEAMALCGLRLPYDAWLMHMLKIGDGLPVRGLSLTVGEARKELVRIYG